MEKMKKMAKGLDTLCKIVFRVSLVVAVGTLLLLGILWLLYSSNPAILDQGQTSLNFGGISFRLAETVRPERNQSFWFWVLSTVFMVVNLPVYCLMIRSIRGILTPMKEGKPFDGSIADHIKSLGWLTIAGGILDQLGQVIVSGNALAGYDLGELFLSDKITHVTTSYSFDLNFVLYAVVLFLLSAVFRYGTELQQLSDETL